MAGKQNLPPEPVEFELMLPDEFAGRPEEEVAQERRAVEDRADRVRRRVSMNQVYIRPLPPRSRKKDTD